MREEREDSPWTEEWEFKQQEEKEVYRPQERKMEFRSKRVTDMPTNRFVHIPNPAGPEVETVLDNISCRVNTYLYISKTLPEAQRTQGIESIT